jgi:orotate phosphoribosyltransferase
VKIKSNGEFPIIYFKTKRHLRMTVAAEIAHRLLKINAIKLQPNNPFTWASGLQSPIYCDNRVSLSFPEVRTFVKNALSEAAKTQFGDFDVVAGVATAGIPQGALVADLLEKPFIYVRSSAKEHGRQNLIEGELRAGQRVLVIEDLISTGGSSLKAVDSLREVGANVVGLLAIFTYGFEKANRAFSEKSVKWHAISNYNALIEVAVAGNFVENEDLATLKNWSENPEKWGALYV